MEEEKWDRTVLGGECVSLCEGEREERAWREREGKGLEGETGSGFTWWESSSKLQALLASEQQAARQKLAQGRDRLLGKLYHAPSAWALHTRLASLVPPPLAGSMHWTPPIQSNYDMITISNPVIAYNLLLSHCTAVVMRHPWCCALY